MPYTTLLWGEEQQANGLTGTAAIGPTGTDIAQSADKNVLPTNDNIRLYRFGMTGDTKPAASAIIPDNANSNKAYYGPGSVKFYPDGILDLRDAPKKLWSGDSLTGQTNSTNVNEGSVLMADIAFSAMRKWSLADFANAEIYYELATVTSVAAVTYNSGPVTVVAACTNTVNWFDPNGVYFILGVYGITGAATFGGVLNITGLSGVWKGFAPGIPVNGLSAVTFSTQQNITLALEPIGPISGIEMNSTAKVGMTASSAGAMTFGLIIARVK